MEKEICPELFAELRRTKIEKVVIGTCEDAEKFLRPLYESMDIYESFFAVYLNQANITIGWYKVSQGGITGTVCDIRLIMKKALEVAATGMLLSHNHPSGNLKPSDEDIRITERIKGACKLFDIKLFDHIILTEGGCYSFTENGRI